MESKMISKRKIRILAYGDSPAVPSGFGTVMYNLFKRLADSGEYEIDIFGINDRGNWKDPEEHPYRIYPAASMGERDFDPYGRGKFINTVRGGDPDLTPYWDLIFFLNDPYVLERPVPYFKLGTLQAIADIQRTYKEKLPPETWFKTIGYFPVDSALKPRWVSQAVGQVNYPVAYTEYGKKEMEMANEWLVEPLDLKIEVIPHGHDLKNYHPLEEATVNRFRKEYFGGRVRPDTFLVIGVGRNQARKDLARTMYIFREFNKRRPDSHLYLHTQEMKDWDNPEAGWGSLVEFGNQIGLKLGRDWSLPQDFVAMRGFEPEVLNGIYNSADILLSTTQGEGWGLPLTEAMACDTLVMAPNITSIPEILNSQGLEALTPAQLVKKPVRGIPLKSGSSPSEWTSQGAADFERLRPLTNVEDSLDKLFWVYDHPEAAKKITKRARKWVLTLNWDEVVKTWDRLFKEAYAELKEERKAA